MTDALQVCFALGGVLLWGGVGIIALNLRLLRQGKPVRELSSVVATRAAVLFIATALAASLPTRQLWSEGPGDFVLFTVVFASASVVLVWLAGASRMASHPALSLGITRVAVYGVPLGTGVLVGVA